MAKTRNKKVEISFVEKMLLFHKAGFSHSGASYTQTKNIEDELLELPERIQKILQIVNRTHLTANQMLYFIMYDIENNKVRTAISKYLGNLVVYNQSSNSSPVIVVLTHT